MCASLQEYVGSWISYIDDLPSETDAKYNITDYYTEPEEVCIGSKHKYPGWYHVVLACVESAINVTGRFINTAELLFHQLSTRHKRQCSHCCLLLAVP